MKALLGLASLALLVPAAAAGLEAVQDIGIRQGRYDPPVAVVHVGDTVVWTNFDTALHTVTDYDGHFGSALLGKGQTFSFTFTEPGVHAYHCTIHALLNGALVVAP